MIVLRALGTAEIDTGVTTLTPSQEIVFAAALYLILERGKRVSRTRLASLLWPQVPEKARAHRLRQTILQLKKMGVMVRADRDSLQLSQYDARTDFDELARAQSDQLSAYESFEFMPGYCPTFAEPFGEWIDSQREQVHAVATARLVKALNNARQKGDWSTSDRLALHCRRLDPFNETAVLAHAEVTAIRGSKKEALAIIDRYLGEVGSANTNLTLSATILRKRIAERLPERGVHAAQECTFVGRDFEMEKLSLRLLDARKGKGGACLVTGEAGIGKSRLASEVSKLAELDGIIVERAVCRRPDLDRPLSVFADLVPRLRELRGALGCSQETIAALKRLAEFDTAANDANSIIDSTAVNARMRRALFDLFDAISDEQCVMVILDDLQWLDPASVALLAAMIPWANTKNLFFLLNQRVGNSPLRGQISEIELPVLELSALARSSAKMLLATIIDEQSRRANEDLINRLLTIGEGNPFFLQELGKHWIETGKQQELPPSIAAVLDDRLSRLSSEALQVLQACAVLGLNATIERVEHLLEYKSHRLLSAVQELSDAGMLHAEGEESTDTPGTVTTRHDLLATAALKRLAKTPLAFLHRRAGTVLQQETLSGGTPTSLLWACALHWRHAGDRERSFSAARACAEHLLDVGLPLDSAHAFERTFEYCLTDEQRLLILSRLAAALQMHGDWEKSKEVLQRFLELRAKTVPEANTHDDVEFALFDATWRASLENSTLLDDLLMCVNSAEAPAAHRVACGLLALKVASNNNEIRIMEAVYETILPLSDGSMASQCVRFEIDMVFHSACGDMGRIAYATKQFLEAARRETNPLSFSRALMNAAIAYRLAGETEEAETLFQEGLDHAIKHGLLSRATFACYSLVRLYLATGNIKRAREALDRAETLADFGEDIHLIADRHYLIARVSLEEGNIEEASSHYAIMLAETNPNENVNRRTSVAALGIMLAISKGLPIDGLKPLVAQLESMHMLNRASGWQDFESQALASGLRVCGEAEKGHRLLAEYATTYRRERWPLPPVLTELLQLPNQNFKEARMTSR